MRFSQFPAPQILASASPLTAPLAVLLVSKSIREAGKSDGAFPVTVGFDADLGEYCPFRLDPQAEGGWLGVGKGEHPRDLEQALQLFFHRLRTRLPEHICFDLTRLWTPERASSFQDWIVAAAVGVRLASYDLGALKTASGSPDRVWRFPAQISLRLPDGSPDPGPLLERAAALANAVIVSKSVIDLPPNKFTARHFANWAEAASHDPHTTAVVLEKKQLETLGFGGLLGVNRGSAHPPYFCLVDYAPPGASKTVALVGKGVTFDTGGISIKPSENLHFMKCDLGGGAVAMAVVQAAAALALPIRVVAAVPATDNMIGPGALTPGDILTIYGGITVEVIDTDAEGRLILADALSYVTERYPVDVLIDMATLTGACVAALGYEAAGLFSANDPLAASLLTAGERVRDRLWRLPLWDSYSALLESDIADIKNLGGRVAGASTAAKFLEKFTRNHAAWAHLDIAGVVFADTPFSKMKAATGWGARLLIDWLEAASGRDPA